MKITAETRSDQLNADDLRGASMTVTIKKVEAGKAEQPFDLVLEETSKVWRPPKTVRALLIEAWGNDAGRWIGRRAVLYRDPNVTYGANAVGGIRVSHLSDIAGPLETVLLVRRGKHEKFTVQPLTDEDTGVTLSEVENAETVEELRKLWAAADPNMKTEIEARVEKMQQERG